MYLIKFFFFIFKQETLRAKEMHHIYDLGFLGSNFIRICLLSIYKKW